MNPIECKPAVYSFHVVHSVKVKVDGLSRKSFNDVVIAESDDSFNFETQLSYYANKTVTLTQSTELFYLDNAAGIEKLKDTYTRQIATINVKSRCLELQIRP